MRALALTAKSAPPAVVDVADRAPGAGEVRIAIEAASVNGFDLAVAAGRVWDTMPYEFPVVLGRDYAGLVDAVGEGVSEWQVGDRVAGINMASSLGPGALAEFITVDAATAAAVPDGVTSVQAAAVGLAGITALDLVDTLDPGEGDVLIVSGATGGVGGFALQLAVARGARVVATARPGDATRFVRDLGAADVVDYTGDLASAVRAVAPNGVTKAAHAAGSAAALGELLTAGGHLASVLGATAEQVSRDDITVTAVVGRYRPAKLEGLLRQVAAGDLTVPVTAILGLDNAAAALGEFHVGKLGKIVVVIR